MDLLFPDAPPPVPRLPALLPAGFSYTREFITRDEERELLALLRTLELKPAQYHEFTAQRRTACFGLGIRFNGPLAERGLELRRHPPAPRLIQYLVDKVARQARRDPRDFPHALVTEYPPGAPIGWHRDAPPFAAIFGVSLGSDCTFCLRPQLAAESVAPGTRRQDVIKLTAERRSLYIMAGPSRSAWQHSIPAVKELRYSITLRTLR